MHKQQGFTLLEVLLAITITAFIGVGSTQLLSSIIETKSATESRGLSFKVTQRADLWIKRDLWQIAGRETHDSLGGRAKVLSNQTDYTLEFTRSGLANHPFSKSANSNLQRIAYDIQPLSTEACELAETSTPHKTTEERNENYCLIRLIWPTLDNIEGTEPLQQILLDEITELKFEFRGQIIVAGGDPIRGNDWMENWPPLYVPDGGTPDLAQIKMILTLPKLGEIERIYEVPRYAYQE